MFITTFYCIVFAFGSMLTNQFSLRANAVPDGIVSAESENKHEILPVTFLLGRQKFKQDCAARKVNLLPDIPTEGQTETMPNNGQNTAIGGGGFHHIAIRAYDFDATLKFYMEGLGCIRRHTWGKDEREAGGKDSRAAMLDCGDGNYIEVFAGREGTPGAELPEGGLLHFALRTSDTPAALERARNAGATVTMETKTVVPDNSETQIPFTIAFVRGLDGEIIEFFHSEEL
jgi:glyoxylase I family protein